MLYLSHHPRHESPSPTPTRTPAAARSRHPHHHHRRPSRLQGPSSPRPALRLHALLLCLVTWSALLGFANAWERRAARGIDGSAPLLALPVDDIPPVWTGPQLVIDSRPPPAPPLLMPPVPPAQPDHHGDATPTASAPPSKRSLETDASASSAPFTIPKPFDTALSNNFTADCANFWRRMLTNEAFDQCHPFSMMLQTSNSFFNAQKTYIRITQTLEATCNVNMTQCLGTMNGLARELVSDGACRADYENDNPQVLQAYNGLIAYEPLYQASCLRDDQGSYCFANAVTNTSATTDSYPYYLPLGSPMPGGARPTCNSCLQDAMAIFSSFAGNSTQPISKTYDGAAGQIAISCGPNFVNRTATPLKGAAGPGPSASLTPTLTLITMLLVYWLQ